MLGPGLSVNPSHHHLCSSLRTKISYFSKGKSGIAMNLCVCYKTVLSSASLLDTEQTNALILFESLAFFLMMIT